MKKKLKLLKGLSKNISMFSDMGYLLDPDHGLADQVKGQMISEAADMLLAQLEQLKAEKKEIKRQRKEEKSKLKDLRMQNKEVECKRDSSSCSESSDSECGEVVDMNSLNTKSLSLNNQQPISQGSKITLANTPNLVEEKTIGTLAATHMEDKELSESIQKLYIVMRRLDKKIAPLLEGGVFFRVLDSGTRVTL